MILFIYINNVLRTKMADFFLFGQVHVLPKEVLGKSTYELAALLLKWVSLRTVDKILLFLASWSLGNTDKYGLKRPEVGPLELKNTEGKTPVLDLGTFGKIKSGQIKVVPGIKRFARGKVAFVNGEILEIDSVVLATGYRSNVPSWLKVGILNHSFIFLTIY